jgi:hypothetical protein
MAGGDFGLEERCGLFICHHVIIVLDACTLFPAALRDVLMRLALHRLIFARWTDAIHDEWIEAVLHMD